MVLKGNAAEYAAVLADNGIVEEIEYVDLGTGKHENEFSHAHGSEVQFGKIVFRDAIRDPYPLFIKVEPKNEMLAQLASKYRFCIKEGAFYKTLLKEMRTLWKQRTGDDKELRNVYPIVFEAEPDAIVMKNLTVEGYRVLNVMEGETINLNEAKLVLKALASQHGTTHVMIEEAGGVEAFRSKYAEELRGNYYEVENKEWTPFFNPQLQKALEILKNSNLEGAKEAIEVLTPYEGRLFETICEQRNRRNPVFSALVHGDFHPGNILFKFDDHGLQEIKIVDLQTCIVASPTIDLQYYIPLALNEEAWKQSVTQLLTYYYEELGKVVNGLGGKLKLSFEDLVAEYRKDRIIGLLVSLRLKMLFASLTNKHLNEDTTENVEEKWAAGLSAINDATGQKLAADLIAVCLDYKKNTQ